MIDHVPPIEETVYQWPIAPSGYGELHALL